MLSRGAPLSPDQLSSARGGFLPGYAPDHSETYGEWLDGFRARVVVDVSRAILREVHRARSAAEWHIAEDAARACLALDPLNEEGTLALAEMLAIGGSKARAVKLLDDFIAEVGDARSTDLRVPASTLRRRISESSNESYRQSPGLPFMGRAAELTLLRASIDQARNGTSQCVVIHGEPGIGKSRLASELANLAGLEGLQVVRLMAEPASIRQPMSAFVELVPHLLRLRGALGCSPSSMKVLQRLTSAPSTNGTESGETAIADVIADSIVDALEDLIDAVSVEAPLLALIDDAHLLDDLSLRTIAELVQLRSPRRLCIVLTSRETERLDLRLRHVDRSVRLALKPIDVTTVESLAEHSLREKNERTEASVIRWMADTSAGNPLFLETLIARYVEAHIAFEMPESLRGLLRRRLDGLSPTAFAVLQSCAVLGRHSTFDCIVAALNIQQVDLLLAINELDAAYAITSNSDVLVPSHPLLAELALERSSSASIRLLHSRAAIVLQDDDDEPDSPTRLWDCAEHWVAANEDERAVACLRRCAEHAVQIGQLAAASGTLLRASELRVDRQIRIQLAIDAVRLGREASDPHCALRAATALRGLGEPRCHDDIELTELWGMLQTHERIADLELRAQECMRCVDASPSHRVEAGLTLLKHSDWVGRGDLATAVRDAVTDADLNSVDDVLRAEYCLVVNSVFKNSEATVRAARSILKSVSLEPPARAFRGLFNSAIGLWHAGEVHEAESALCEAHKLSWAARWYAAAMRSACALANLVFDLDRLDAAAEWRRRAHEAANRRVSSEPESVIVWHDLEAALASGNVGEAERLHRTMSLESGAPVGALARLRRCSDLRIKQLHEATSVTDGEAATLLDSSSSHFSLTFVRDFEIGVAYAAMHAAGRADSSRSMLDAYLRDGRQTRAPVSRLLRCIVAQTEAEPPMPAARFSSSPPRRRGAPMIRTS